MHGNTARFFRICNSAEWRISRKFSLHEKREVCLSLSMWSGCPCECVSPRSCLFIYVSLCVRCYTKLNDPNREFLTTENDSVPKTYIHIYVHIDYVRINRWNVNGYTFVECARSNLGMLCVSNKCAHAYGQRDAALFHEWDKREKRYRYELKNIHSENAERQLQANNVLWSTAIDFSINTVEKVKCQPKNIRCTERNKMNMHLNIDSDSEQE